MASLTGYDKSQRVKVTGNKPAAALSWYPQLISFDHDAGLKAYSKNAGLDIAFTVDGDDTELPYERDHWVDHGASVSAGFWVRNPTISGVDESTLRIYIGKTGGTAYPTPSDTWNENGAGNFKSVWHLHDNFLDSTVNSNDGTNTGSIDGVGVVGSCQNFDGVDDHVATPENFDGYGALTVEVWANPDTTADYKNLFIAGQAGGDNAKRNFVLGFDTSTNQKLNFICSDGADIITGASGAAIPTSAWNHYAGTYDGQKSSVLTNGVDDGAPDSFANPRNLGSAGLASSFGSGYHQTNHNWSSVPYDGRLDEVRVSNVVRSDAWILFGVKNMGDYVNTITHGSWVSAPGPPEPDTPSSYTGDGTQKAFSLECFDNGIAVDGSVNPTAVQDWMLLDSYGILTPPDPIWQSPIHTIPKKAVHDVPTSGSDPGVFPFQFFGDLRTVDPYWSGGNADPSVVGETKELYVFMDSHTDSHRVKYGVPIRKGHVHRLSVHMQNRLAHANAIMLYPVIYLDVDPCPDQDAPWPLVLTVTGALAPDATGVYVRNGQQDGKPAYQRVDGAYWLWWTGSVWRISAAKGEATDYWASAGSAIVTTYANNPAGSTTGTATVAITPWATINNSYNHGHSALYLPTVGDDELLSVMVQTTVVYSWGYEDTSYPLINAIVEQRPLVI